MKDLYIKVIENSNSEYLALIQEIGGVFNDPVWLDLFGTRLRLYGIYEHDSLQGAFSLYHTRLFGFSYIKNPVTTPHCGLIYRNESVNRFKHNSREKAIHTCLAGFLRSLKPAVVQFILPPGVTDVQPYLWQGFKVSPAYTYRLDLTRNMEEISSQFDAKLRSDIGKAQKDGVSAEMTMDFAIVGKIVKKTFERQKTAVPHDLIDRILHRYSTPANSFVFVARHGEKPVAAVMCVYDSTTSYYILGGYDADNRHRGAASAAILASIRHAKSLGLQTFDFEGSMIPAIESFFRGFGGDLTVKYAVHRAWLPLEIALKLVKREIY